MKTIISLLLLSTSFVVSAPTTSNIVQTNQTKFGFKLLKNIDLKRVVPKSRKSRDARECRFYPRTIAVTRVARVARLNRVSIHFKKIDKFQNKRS